MYKPQYRILCRQGIFVQISNRTCFAPLNMVLDSPSFNNWPAIFHRKDCPRLAVSKMETGLAKPLWMDDFTTTYRWKKKKRRSTAGLTIPALPLYGCCLTCCQTERAGFRQEATEEQAAVHLTIKNLDTSRLGAAACGKSCQAPPENKKGLRWCFLENNHMSSHGGSFSAYIKRWFCTR